MQMAGRKKVLGAIAIAAAALLSSGCLSGGDDPAEPVPGSGGVDPADVYPEGPYGTSVGSVIRNYRFEGYAQPGTGVGEMWRNQIALADFYNPTGDGTYPSMSAFEPGGKLPRALVIDLSASHCAPCNLAAKNTLPKEHAHYKPLGAEIILVLAEGYSNGQNANFIDLDAWVSKHASLFPSVLDPTQQMTSVFLNNAFPLNLIIDTRDMTIVEMVTGVPEAGFWTKLESLLAEEP